MSLRVMVVDADIQRAFVVESAIHQANYQSAGMIDSVERLYDKVKQSLPDAIVVSVDCLDRDSLGHIRQINQDMPRPIVIFTNNGSPEMIEASIDAGASATIVDGLQGHRIKPIIDTAVARFKHNRLLHLQLDELKASLMERKIIDRAKGILMQKRGFTEDQAYTFLRKIAMNKNKRIAEVAERLLCAAELLD